MEYAGSRMDDKQLIKSKKAEYKCFVSNSPVVSFQDAKLFWRQARGLSGRQCAVCDTPGQKWIQHCQSALNLPQNVCQQLTDS